MCCRERTKKMKGVTALLRKVWRSIDTPEKWTKGTMQHDFRNAMGDLTCRKMCLIGAVCYATNVPNLSSPGENELVDATFDRLSAHLDKKWLRGDRNARGTLMDFNDAPETTHEDIERLFMNAIAEEEPA